MEPLISNNSVVSKGTYISHADTNPICFNEEKNRASVVSRPTDSLCVFYFFLSGFDKVQACVSERAGESVLSYLQKISIKNQKKKTRT